MQTLADIEKLLATLHELGIEKFESLGLLTSSNWITLDRDTFMKLAKGSTVDVSHSDGWTHWTLCKAGYTFKMMEPSPKFEPETVVV